MTRLVPRAAQAELGLAPDDAHGLIAPQAFDEPAVLVGAGAELMGPTYGQEVHRLPLAAVRRAPELFAACGAAKTSR